MPEQACLVVYDWIVENPVFIRITKPRRTKLGDYRPHGKRHGATITVNGNLNPYAFAITLTHEIAHHIDYTLRGTLQNPHGNEWKRIYTQLLEQLLECACFPHELEPAIRSHLINPKAASCSDPNLLKYLSLYDPKPTLRLEDLKTGESFKIKGHHMIFVKGELKRTRYRCKNVSSQKHYMVHGLSEVEQVNS